MYGRQPTRAFADFSVKQFQANVKGGTIEKSNGGTIFLCTTLHYVDIWNFQSWIRNSLLRMFV